MTGYFVRGGAHTTVFDLPFGAGWEVVPFAAMDTDAHSRQAAESCRRLRNSWWFTRRHLGFEAAAVYGDIYDPPRDLGPFDVAFFGAILLHLSNPFRALASATAMTEETIVVTDLMTAPARLTDQPEAPPVVLFGPSPPPAGLVHWWTLTPNAVRRMLEVLGFGDAAVTLHQSAAMVPPPPMFTVVARRTVARRSAVGAAAAPVPEPPAPAPVTVAPMPAPPQIARAALRQRAADLPLPPPELRFKVAGTEDLGVFLELGKRGYDAMIAALGAARVPPDRLGAVLDFGCGVGRVLRYWSEWQNLEVHGTDYYAEAIKWCRESLSFAQFDTNTLEGPLRYETGTFGLVYALSVFTHLPEALQREWFAELIRVLRPGGLLYFTTHGDWYRDQLPAVQRAEYARGYLAVVGDDQPGTNFCGAFHPPSYVRRELIAACGASLVEFKPQGARGNPEQDSYLVQKHGGPL